MSCCYEPGQVLVQPKSGGWEALSQLFRQSEIGTPDILYSTEDILRHYRLLNRDTDSTNHLPEGFTSYPVLIRVPQGQEIDRARQYRGLPAVAVAVPNYYVKPALSGLAFTEDLITEISEITGLGNAVPSCCGSDVNVAILDSGVDVSVLINITSKIQQYDTDIPRDLSTGLDPYDPTGHGTVVAHLILRGAPGINILPIKVMQEQGNLMGSISGLFIAIAARAPEIINMSLSLTCDTGYCHACGSGSSEFPVTFEQLKLLFGQVDKIYTMNNKPLPLLVAAAGNVRPGDPLTIPACFDNVLAVGACNGPPQAGQPTEYSRYGKVPEGRFLRAPGGLDHPERCIATLRSAPGKESGRWETKRFFGTSFAAPVVTAIAARYLCSTKANSPCGLRQGIREGREFLMDCISQSADRTLQGYDQTLHGLGLARYSQKVAVRAIQKAEALLHGQGI